MIVASYPGPTSEKTNIELCQKSKTLEVQNTKIKAVLT